MYHAIVRRRIRALFTAINRGDAEPVLTSFARRFEHAFLGEHALGGARHTLSATRRWYERLYRLLPDIHFDLRQIEPRRGFADRIQSVIDRSLELRSRVRCAE